MLNEKRLIDANKVAQDVRNNNRDNFYRADWTSKRVVELLESAPTVDAVEVVHGWWIELPGMEPDYRCSECGQSYAWWEPSEAHYCPNCGAKMDGDGNG
jgi:rubrerythrin